MDFHLVVDALTKTVTDIVQFIPRLINGLIVLVIGYLVAWAARWLVRAILGRLRIDPLVERSGLTASLRGLGIRAPLSQVAAQAIFALLLLSFLITASRLMGLEAVAVVLERVLAFLPNAIAALVVFLLGGLVAAFLGDLVATLAGAEGLAYAARIGRVVRYLVSIVVAVLALGVLGLDTALLVTVLTIMVAAFGLALALALGLGMRQVVAQIMAGYYLRQRLPAGRRIALGELRGEVRGVGSVSTVLATSEEDVVVPNGVIFGSVVRLARPAAAEGESRPEPEPQHP